MRPHASTHVRKLTYICIDTHIHSLLVGIAFIIVAAIADEPL